MTNKNKQNSSDHGKILHSWIFPEFARYERSNSWYIKAGVIFAFFILFSYFSGNLLFGMVIVIAVMATLLFRSRNSDINFQITEDGVIVNDKFYEYSKFKNFFIIYQPPEVKMLYMEPNSFFSPKIPVSLEDQNPIKIRETLKKYIDEDLEQENEPLSDQLSRMLKL